jgi:hypothetical protein
MEAFKAGEHVIVEMDDESMVAGYLDDYLDDGWVLRVTHKEMRVVHAISPELAADIRKQLEAKTGIHLRIAAVLSGDVSGVLGKRAEVVEYLAGKFEEKMLAKYSETMQLRELKAPVTTFLSHHVIRTMESTKDRNITEELNGFDIDGTLEEILTKSELTSEDSDGKIE